MMNAPSAMLAIFMGSFSYASFLFAESPPVLRTPDLLAPVLPQWPVMEGNPDGDIFKLMPLMEIVLPRPEISEQTRAAISTVPIIRKTQESGIPVRPDLDAGGKSPWPHPWRLDQSPRMKLEKFRIRP